MLTEWLDARLYPDTPDRWDDHAFRALILEYLSADMVALDLGAGAGRIEEMDFRGRCRHVCGLDPDERVRTNPFLDEAEVGQGEHIPWDDSHFDLVFSDNVLEHLEDPSAVFREVHRVLAPGGVALFKTPNRRHYMPRIAAHTPTSFHKLVNSLRGREPSHTFKTFYRANTTARVRELAGEVGLEVERFHLVEDRPEYLRLTPPTYLVGALWERVVNRIEAAADFRVVLMVVLRKETLPPEPGV